MPEEQQHSTADRTALAHANRSAAAKQLPAVASEIISAALQAVGYSVPGLGALAKFMELYGERTLEKGRQLLIDEISKGNIDEIKEETLNELFGCSYRFFEATRRGEYEHNLRIIGEIITHGIEKNTLTSSDINFNFRLLESLSEFEIRILALCGTWAKQNPLITPTRDDPKFICAQELTAYFPNLKDEDQFRIRTALVVLSSRGFLIPDGATRLSKSEEYYIFTNHLVRIAEMAERNINKHSSDGAAQSGSAP